MFPLQAVGTSTDAHAPPLLPIIAHGASTEKQTPLLPIKAHGASTEKLTPLLPIKAHGRAADFAK